MADKPDKPKKVDGGEIRKEEGGKVRWMDTDGKEGTARSETEAKAMLSKRLARKAEKTRGGGLPRDNK